MAAAKTETKRVRFSYPRQRGKIAAKRGIITSEPVAHGLYTTTSNST